MQANLLDDGSPKPNRVAALEEKVSTRFLLPLAKRAEAAIWPPTLLEAVGSPNAVLGKEPSKEFSFGRSPSLPNRLVEIGSDGADELHLISRFSGVIPICREIPSNVIIQCVMKLHPLTKSPKVEELREVSHGEVVAQLDHVDPSISI